MTPHWLQHTAPRVLNYILREQTFISFAGAVYHTLGSIIPYRVHILCSSKQKLFIADLFLLRITLTSGAI